MNKNGFTLVELLAVIAILALLVIIALPNVLNMFNQAKKDVFLTEVKTIYKEVSKKYISENMKGNKVNNISNSSNKLDLDSNNLDYNIKLDSKGNIKDFQVSNDTYCLSGKFKNLSELTIDKITEGECQKLKKSFKNDSWETIVDNVRNSDIEGYNVGDTKEIDLGTYGTHTVRIANVSTPSECSTEGFSQTACGFVIEFADIITTHIMNPGGIYKGKNYYQGWNKDGWPASNLYLFVNNDIYNALPNDLKSVIIDTRVVSGHGSEDTDNFVSIDKLYLLSTVEVWEQGTTSTIDYDTTSNLTRQLDYYQNLGVTTDSYSGAIKKKGTVATWWWLRSTFSCLNDTFYLVYSHGGWLGTEPNGLGGVSPAFRIG